MALWEKGTVPYIFLSSLFFSSGNLEIVAEWALLSVI